MSASSDILAHHRSDDLDDRDPMRGVIIGMLLAAPCWAALAFGAYLLLG